MKTKLRSFFSLLAILSIFASCEKELSVEKSTGSGSSTGTSVYTFAGATGDCTAPVINGTYTVNTAATSANTVELQVTVTKIGTYTISTATINGLTFSASGTFISTGAQTIIFTAAGTPVIKGSFPYSPGFNGCSFSITVLPAGASNTAVFTYPLAPNACSPYNVSGTYMVGLALTSGNTVKISVTVTAIGNYSVSTISTNGISFAASGSFTALGNQTLTLTGSGKPLAVGTFNYTPSNNGCSFPITVVAAAPPATFTVQNDGSGNCTAYTVNGTYTEAVALTTANTVQLTANVTVIGSYSISTNTANGITFSASGNFTTLGVQTILLSGSGTPTAASTDLFTPVVATGACAFQIITAPKPAITDGSITCKIDGVAKTFTINAKGVLTPLAAAPPVPAYVDLEISGSVSATSVESIVFDVAKVGTSFTAGEIFNGSGMASGKMYTFSYTTDSGVDFSSVAGVSTAPFTITITSVTAIRAIGTFSGTASNVSGVTSVITEGTFNVPI